MDIIEYLREFGNELAGIRDKPREVVLRYVRFRLLAVLEKVTVELSLLKGEKDDNDSEGTGKWWSWLCGHRIDCRCPLDDGILWHEYQHQPACIERACS